MTTSLFTFKDDPELGGAVSSAKVFCKLTQGMPVPSYDYIVGKFGDPRLHGLAGHKYSRLCGFTFTSNVDAASPAFQFVYVPKLRGNFTRNNRSLHGWYCWRYVSPDQRDIVSINEMKSKYGFSINKFVNSDMFDKYVPSFIYNIHYALGHQVKELYDSISDSSKRKELDFYIRAIRTSLSDIKKVKEIVSFDEFKRRHGEDVDNPSLIASMSDPKAGHARVAYNADKTYGLKNLDKNAAQQSQG